MPLRAKVVAGIALLIAAVGIAMIVSFLSETSHTSYIRDMQVVCLADNGELHGFTITGSQFIRHLRSKEPIECSECGGINLARAAPCVDCGKFMPTGVHGLPPDNCPHCGFAQPSPTVSDHAQLHAPGAHGEEPTIVPLLEDDEPE